MKPIQNIPVLQPPPPGWSEGLARLFRPATAAAKLDHDADAMFAGLYRLARQEETRSPVTHHACLARRETHVRGLASYMQSHQKQPDAIARVFAGRDWSGVGATGLGVLYGVVCAAALAASPHAKTRQETLRRVKTYVPGAVRADLGLLRICANNFKEAGFSSPARYCRLHGLLLSCQRVSAWTIPDTNAEALAIQAASGTLLGLAGYFPEPAPSQWERLHQAKRKGWRLLMRSTPRPVQEAAPIPKDLKAAIANSDAYPLWKVWEQVQHWAATMDDEALRELLHTISGVGNTPGWVYLGGLPGAIYAGAVKRWSGPQSHKGNLQACGLTPQEVYEYFARLIPKEQRLPLDTVHAIVTSARREGRSAELITTRIRAALADLKADRRLTISSLGLMEFSCFE